MLKSGIYKITCLVNNKIYIGSAKNLSIRKTKHFCMLKEGCHHNKKLQRSFNKYGLSNFVFEIIELVEDKTKLIEREQYYLDTLLFANENYKRFSELGFNFKIKADSNLGTKQSDSWVQKRVAKQINRKRTLEQIQNISKAHIGIHVGKKYKTPIRGVCIHCGKEVSVSNLKQFHNNNCKFKTIAA